MSHRDTGADALNGAAERDAPGMVETLLGMAESERLTFARDRRWPADALVRELKGRSFALLGADPPRALSLAEFGLQLATLTADAATGALAARGLAQALHACGQYAAALTHYDQSVEGYTGAGDTAEAARSMIGLVEVLMYLGRYADALRTARTARATFAALDDHRRVARLDVNLGNVLHRLDRPREALAAYDRASTVLEPFGDDLELAVIAHNRGNVLAGLNRFEEAMTAYAAATATYAHTGRTANLAQTLYNQAYLYFLQGHFGAALTGMAQARRHFTALNDRRHLALCDLDEAQILLGLNRMSDAQALAVSAARAFDDLGMRYEAAKARVFMALALHDDADRAAADALLREAGDLFTGEGNTFWIASVHALAAGLALQWGDTQRAIDHCDTALRLLAPFPPTSRAGSARVLRGQVLRLQGRADAALASVEAGCRDAALLGDRMLSHQAHHALGLLHEDRGDHDAAAAAFRHAMDDVDWLRGGIARDDLRISFVHDKVALYEGAVRNALRRRQSAEAFAYVERAKARALVDVLAAGPAIGIRADAEDAQAAERVQELRAGLSALYSRLHGEGERRRRSTEGHAALLRHMRLYEAELTARLHQLRVRQPDYVSLRSGMAVGLDDVRVWLGDDVLLEYYLLDDQVLAFVVTQADVGVVGPLATGAEIADLVRRWHHHLAQFSYGPPFIVRHAGLLRASAHALLQALYARLVAPLASSIADRALVIVPHGPLHHVPFHALFDGRRYLVEDHDISYAPSATAVVVQGSRRRDNDGVLIVGVPAPALPHIAAEVRAVAACHPRRRLLLGARATRRRFAAAGRDSRCIHLATHAMFRADAPLFSAIQLADAWLTVADIYDLDLAADLVVLSACETGTSMVLRGDEVVGMLRGFLYAGAQTLVSSLWAANDAATAGLMSAFHRAVGAGADARRALCGAQRQALAGQAHPYYWAPFSVCGQVGHRHRGAWG